MREKYESLSLTVLKDLAKARGMRGISTMKKVLDYLNIETNIESLHHEIDEDYSLQIKLNKKLLIRRGR